MSDVTFSIGKIAKPIVKAAINLATKARIVTQASPELQAQRLATCNGCDLLTPARTCDGTKGGCRCIIDQKIRVLTVTVGPKVNTIKCPLGKW